MPENDTISEPKLASSLSESEIDFRRRQDEVLYNSGVKSVDLLLRSTLKAGRIIGVGNWNEDDVGYERAESTGGGGGGYDLGRCIIATTLLEMLSSHPKDPKSKQKETEDKNKNRTEIYIIAPPSTSIISDIHNLVIEKLISRGKYPDNSSASEAALRALSSVVLMQYFDLVGLSESLAEVSGRLYQQSQSLSSGSGSKTKPKRQGSILLIQGLSRSIAATQKRNGLVHACALVAGLLRTLTVLSRSFSDFLVLVDVEAGVVSGGRKEKEIEAGEVESAFARVDGSKMEFVPGGVVGNLLKKGLDVVVMVHDGFGKMGRGKNGGRVVEVVKDRVGDMLGEWTVWAGVG